MIFNSIKHTYIHDNFTDYNTHLPLNEISNKINNIPNTLESKNYNNIYMQKSKFPNPKKILKFKITNYLKNISN